MKFDLNQTLTILSRTPDVLHAQLHALPDEWVMTNEGPDTWSPFLIVGHLIVCEEINFFARTLYILSEDENKVLTPLDMTTHLQRNNGRSIDELLTEFTRIRQANIEKLKSLNLSPDDLQKTALHPKVGEVNIAHILSTWVAHDLTHIGQISRVMAKQYKQAVGPFIEFLTRLQ